MSKKLQEAIDDSVEIHALEEPWDRKRRRVRSQTDHRTTSRNPSPTNQPQRAVPAEFSHRSYARQGPMASGPRQARIGITDVRGMRISAGTVTPATVVPLGTRRNGDVRPITTAVTIDVRHHHQDVPVTWGKEFNVKGSNSYLFWVKIDDFWAVWPCNLTYDLEKQ